MNDDERQDREQQLTRYEAANPRPLYQMIYDLAITFREVGTGAVQTILQKQNADFFVPAAVNTAFSVELLLKFFIVAAHPDLSYAELKARELHPRGHKYSELWNKLHPKFRGAILAEYSMLTQAGTVLPDIPAVLSELGDAPFVNWRYPFEDPAYRELDYTKLEHVADAMLRVGRGACRRLAQGEREYVV